LLPPPVRIARPSATFPPLTEHKLSEVVGISRDVPLNNATRDQVDRLVIDSLVLRRGTAPTRPRGGGSRTSPVRCSASVDAWHAGGPQAVRHEEI
jgi:hypothetical protein